ncbi:uncharacterized protein LOC128393025 [Panonychus citri]|uniref:uncharacterized protein LOC128393025 n=1 Tax=Panonychus citri TaxID=50023 RepID=UPI0023079AA2|nr:uncharacterized protein LOC128393025 [Panonychus citri]
MKFSLALIALFCVSAINAKAIKDPSPFAQIIINLVEGLVQSLETNIPDWDASASLEKNVITVVDKKLESGALPDWKPDAPIEENLVNALESYIRSLKIQDLDETKTITENLDAIVTDFLKTVPFPSWFTKDDIQMLHDQMVQNALEALKNIHYPGFDVNKSIDDNVVALADAAIAEAKLDPKASSEDAVNEIIKQALSMVDLPGFNPSNTLEQNVADILANLLPF